MPQYHGDEVIIHRLHRWEFLNATNRLAGLQYVDIDHQAVAVTFSARDIGRRGYDRDTKTFWDITDVVAGVPTWSLGSSATDTDTLPEGSTNLYFTIARVWGAILSAWTPAAGTITNGDTLQQLLQKMAGNLTAINGIGKHTVSIPASAFYDGTTTATYTTSTNTYDFSGTTNQDVGYRFTLPKSWNAGTISFAVKFSQSATAAGAVVFALKVAAISDGESTTPTYGSAITVTKTAGTTGICYVSSESSAITIGNTPSKNDLIVLNLQRLATDAGDTVTATVQLIELLIFYTTDAATDV